MLLFMDGFSHYQTTDMMRKWTTRDDTDVTWSIEPAGGRTGGCLKRQSIGNNNDSGYIVKAPTVRQTGVWAAQDRGVCGFAIKILDLERIDPAPNVTNPFNLKDTLLTVYNGPWSMFGVCVNQDGTMSVYKGRSNTILATSIGGITDDTWAYLEFKWVISETTGSIIIRVNGVQVLNYSGILFPTYVPSPPPTAQWTSVQCFGIQSLVAPFLLLRVCDFYLLDMTGSFNNDLLGDVSVKYILPDGVGAANVWTPSAGANWSNVNEVPPNDDTSYNSATPVGTLDLYNFQACGVNPIALQQCILSRRTVPGSATIESVTRPVAVNFNSTAQAVPSDLYNYCLYPYDTNPATGVRWTQAEVDAAQFGVNKAS